ncbi:hypothetical protein [Streptomyces sp. NBC_01314]|uniref:hypothetical protein n=1 Tax=Streptomyces sp. NBC_01314 TaxID=2903821 RepID=UPI003091B7FA|nr:hypothetical protein OG622_41790 [Streptomyces sp. NBC_01314]
MGAPERDDRAVTGPRDGWAVSAVSRGGGGRDTGRPEDVRAVPAEHGADVAPAVAWTWPARRPV